MLLTAQLVAGYSLVQLLIIIIVVAAICAVISIGLRAMGVTVPSWLWQILGIIAVVAVVIIAIKLLASMV